MKAALSDKLAALKKQEAPNIPTPLWVFLYIYEQAPYDCYIRFQEGAKLLYNYLSPIELPAYAAEIEADGNYKVPTLLQGYEVQELARLFPGKSVIVQDIITTCLIKEVLPRILRCHQK